MKIAKNILLTGASSGLGAALALEYAAPGVCLHLQGRNAIRLDSVAGRCRAKGATVFTKALDVTDAPSVERWILTAETHAPLDLVIANAGISAGTAGRGCESGEQVKRIFSTNIDGVINTIHPVLAAMMARKSGHVAIVSSLAGIRALPSSPAYSASKACVRYYGESLRGSLAPHGVCVSVVCPGYITTPMTAVNQFPMPFIMRPEKAARIIVAGLARGKGRIAFPGLLYLPLWWLACLPSALTDPIFARLPAKSSG